MMSQSRTYAGGQPFTFPPLIPAGCDDISAFWFNRVMKPIHLNNMCHPGAQLGSDQMYVGGGLKLWLSAYEWFKIQ